MNYKIGALYKAAESLKFRKTGSLYKAAESLASYKFAAATWMLRGINPAYADQSNKALGALFKGMKRPVKKTFNINFNPKVLSTPDSVQAASNVNNLLQETPIRHSGALLNAMQNKDPDKVQRFLDMRRFAEERNRQAYRLDDIAHRNNMRKPGGRLKQVRQREPQQSTLFTANDTLTDLHNLNYLSAPSTVPTERKWVFAGNEGFSAVAALSPQVIARKALQGKPILSRSYYENKDDLFLSSADQRAKNYLAPHPEVWKPVNLDAEPERKAVEDWLRKNYPAAFTRGRNQLFQPYYNEPLSSKIQAAGFYFGSGNKPRLVRRQEDLTEFRKRTYESLRKRHRSKPEEEINAIVEAAVRDNRIGREAQTSLHEGGHSANDSGERGEAFRKAYRGDVETGVNEVLADNFSKINLPKIFDQPRGSGWAKEVEKQTSWYQKRNILEFLSGNTPETLKALKDLRGVPGTGENLGKLVHPVTGDVLDLSPSIRRLIELRIREIENPRWYDKWVRKWRERRQD